MIQDVSATMLSAGIVADDLTGAGDSAVQFADLGWQARLTLGDPSAVAVVPGSVVAVVTDSRAQKADVARFSTSNAVAQLMAAGIDRLFVKIDSTMRGSVAAQVGGALDVWTLRYPDTIAVVCPAYPVMGRTVESGMLRVDGEGVETTSVGRDPVTPVSTSALADLLPGSVPIRGGRVDASQLAALVEAAGARVVTVDASTDADLRVIAEAVELLGARALPVGSAGLASQMSRVWRRAAEGEADRNAPVPHASAGRAVVVVSSLHDVSRMQHAHLLENSTDVLTLAPTLEEILSADGDDGMGGWIQTNIHPGISASVVVILSPAQRAGDVPWVATPFTTELAPARIAAALSAITDAVVSQLGAGSLVLMGGEGARAVLDRFDAESVIVTHAIGEGTPIGVIDGGRLKGLTVVTKAGGFGSTSALTDLLSELLE